MRDLHSHILPGIDDGSKSIEISDALLKSASENGVTDIMLTPHFIEESSYTSDFANNNEIFKRISFIASSYGINVYLGNEVYFTTNVLELLNNGKITTLNGGRYMLIEIPLYSKANNVKNVFFELISNGIVPILAHPERYESYYGDIDFFLELVEMGVLLQINYVSILGMYGRKAKKQVKKLLKKHLVSFVGSDIHSLRGDRYGVSSKALKKISKLVSDKEFKDIVENNFIKVINNEDI